MLEEVGVLVVAWHDRGIIPRRSIEILAGVAMRSLAEIGASYKEFEPIARAMWERFGSAKPSNLDDDNAFTAEISALVDSWRARAIARLEFETRVILAANSRAEEILAPKGDG